MSRLIDAEKLKDDFCEDCGRYLAVEGEPKSLCRFACNAMKIIDNAPTVNAVEVVRCNNCKYFRSKDEVYVWGNDGRCFKLNLCVNNYDFCSYGKREANK